MSTFKVDTLQSTTGGVTTLTNQSAAKAWLEAVTISSHSITGSFNVSSITDGGTGAFDYVSFTSTMSNTGYSVAASCGNTQFDDGFMYRYTHTTSATGGRVRTHNGNLNDASLNSFVVHGDLA